MYDLLQTILHLYYKSAQTDSQTQTSCKTNKYCNIMLKIVSLAEKSIRTQAQCLFYVSVCSSYSLRKQEKLHVSVHD